MIQEQKDPRTRKSFLEASGIVSGVFYNELKNIKSYAGKAGGQAWTPTHSVSVIIDNDRISLGLFEKTDKRPELRCKDVDGNYHTLTKGAEVSVVVERGEDYNDKPQYSARSGDVLILTPAPAQTASQSQGSALAPYKPKDTTGVVAGNARTAAFESLRGTPYDVDVFNEQVEWFANFSDAKRKEYAAANPGLDAFEIGVAVGQSTVIAAGMVPREDVSVTVDSLLAEVFPKSVEVVKALQVVKAPTASKPATKAAPAKKTTPKKTEAADSGFDDMSDDIPFISASPVFDSVTSKSRRMSRYYF